MDYPLLIRRGFVIGDFESKNEEIMFKKDIERLNSEVKRALIGEEANHVLLAKKILDIHRKFSSLLGNFDVEPDYYLKLGKELASHDNTPESKYILAQIYLEEGDIEGAENAMAEIWKLERKYALFYGEVLVQAGKWGRAMEIYHSILEENKDDLEVWKLLADALYHSGNYEDAERAYLRVLQGNRDDAEAWYRRGLCLKKMDKWGGALQSFQTAVRKDPMLKDAYEEMLSILLEREMYSRAMETLKKMKEVGFDVDERIEELRGRMS